MRKITLILEGVPMPKQSVRASYNKKLKRIMFFQPQEHKERVKDYQEQVRAQLPDDFEIFTKKVYIDKFQVVFPPLASQLRVKKTKKTLNLGGLIEKTTKPDLSDNLKKLPLDALEGIVFKNDSLICKENNCTKWHGKHPRITIVLRGE